MKVQNINKRITGWCRSGVILALLFLVSYPALAIRTDTLNSVSSSAAQNTDKIKLYFKLGKSLFTKNPSSTLDYMQQIIALDGIEENPLYLEALGYIGRVHHLFGDYFIALDYQRKRLEQAQKKQDTLQMIKAMNELASDYLATEYKQEASEYWTKSLFLAEAIDNKKYLATISLNLVKYYRVLGEYHIAMKYLNKIEQGFKGQRNAYITRAFLQKGEIYLDNQQYAQALLYTKKAYQNCLDQRKSLSLAKAYQNLGRIHTQYKKYDLAKQYLDSALYIANAREAYELKGAVYQSYVALFEAQNNDRQVLYYYKKLAKTKEKSYNEKQAKYMADLYSKYKANKKEKEIALLKKNALLKASELKRKRIANYSLWIGLFFILALLILIAIYARLKNKSNKRLVLKNSHIEAQKEEIQVQKEHIEQKNTLLESIHRKVTDSIRYAQTIQSAMLPNESLLKRVFSDVFVCFLPKDIVSGDFYWTAKVREKNLLAVADCTGHGVPGAFMALIGTNILNDILHTLDSNDPAQILTELDQRVREVLKQEQKMNDDGMDITLCSFDTTNPAETQITWCGAKHALMYISKGMEKLQVVRGTNKAIGGFYQNQNKTFINQTLTLDTPTTLYLTSDGFTDQKDENRAKYGSLRFRKLLGDIAQLPPQIQKNKIEQEFYNHKGAAEQIDDVTVLGVQLYPKR